MEIPPYPEQTDTTENITFPKTMCAGDNNICNISDDEADRPFGIAPNRARYQNFSTSLRW